MSHPLADLDGKRKYVFSSGEEDFYLRVVTSPQEAALHTKAIKSLESIIVDSEAQLQKEIWSEGRELKSISKGYSAEEMEGVVAKFPQDFGNEKNKTMFLLENEQGNFVTAILLTINDPHERALLSVPRDIGTFVYVSDISTNEEYRGRNFFSGAFDKVLTMLSNEEKRGLATPIQYSVSMTATTAIDLGSKEEFEYVRNLPRYAKMWQERFEGNQLQNRRILPNNEKIGLDRMPLEKYLVEGGREIDENKIDVLIKGEREKVVAEGVGERVRGLYLEGVSSEYAVIKDQRKTLIEQRAEKGIYRKPKREGTEDVPETSASASSAVAVQQNHPRSKWH